MPWLTLIASNLVLASLLATAAWVVQRRLKQHAAARFLWVLALVKLVTPPVVGVPLVELPATAACTLGMCGCSELPHAGPLATALRSLPAMMLVAWTIGAGWTLALAVRRWMKFRQLVRGARPAPRNWQTLAERLASELSLRRAPQVVVVPGRLPPLVAPGWRRPKVLLPSDLVRDVRGAQRRALLLHELVHIQRRDHLMRWVELAVTVAYWWLPAVRSIGRRLRSCEEACCDAAVVSRMPRARRDYARLLLDVVEFADPLPRHAAGHATAMSAAEDLEQRLLAILAGPAPQRRRRLASILLVAGFAGLVLPLQVGFEFAARAASPVAEASRLYGCESLETFRCPEFPVERVLVSVFCCPE
jgi:beta-lactamase regulating signal transducer with metallopeptidase domain